jgi:hypothetical protein
MCLVQFSSQTKRTILSMITLIGHCGLGHKPPTFHPLSSPNGLTPSTSCHFRGRFATRSTTTTSTTTKGYDIGVAPPITFYPSSLHVAKSTMKRCKCFVDITKSKFPSKRIGDIVITEELLLGCCVYFLTRRGAWCSAYVLSIHKRGSGPSCTMAQSHVRKQARFSSRDCEMRIPSRPHSPC